MALEQPQVSALQALVDESYEHDDLAKLIQSDETSDAERGPAIEKLRRNYSAWYTKSLTHIPADLHDEFRREYEGGPFALKIKKYLFEPLLVSPLYDPNNAVFPRYTHQVVPTFLQPLEAQRHILSLAIQNIVGLFDPTVEQIRRLSDVLQRFNSFLGALAIAREGFDTSINNESELQKLLTPALRLVYRDVRPEDFVPDFGGARSRTDFFLTDEGIALETKMTRPSLSAGKLRDELIIDFQQYASLGRVLGIVAFVYDPDRRLANPAALDDLTNLEAPKPTFVITLAGR